MTCKYYIFKYDPLDPSDKLRKASQSENDTVYKMVDSSKDGISTEEAKERLSAVGLNEVDYDRVPSWYVQLIRSFANPFVLILLAIVVISFVIDVWLAAPDEKDWKTVVVVAVMIVISSLLGFFQEYRSNRAAEKLKSMVKTTAAVLRAGKGREEIPMAQIVPGDIVYLAAGDMIPADCRVLESIDLFIGESMLTGESLPVEKMPLAVKDSETKPPIELNNLCFMGTNVVSGSAKTIVIATGSNTYFGSIGKSIVGESSDIILLEKDLSVLHKGVAYGRVTFGNIMKYIKMATSSNFGNVFSILGASAFLPFLPMLPIQLLVQNLLYDFSQISLPWDTMDEDFLEFPKAWEPLGVRRFMIYIGPISSIFDYVLFAVMFFVFKANSPEHQHLFQTGWFVLGLLSQTLIVHMIRTKKIPFIQSWASAPVLAATSLVMVAGLAIPFTRLASVLSFVPLPLAYFPWLIGILTAYCFLTQGVKNWYIRKFNEWL